MADNFVTILDNFYSSPADMRGLALTLDFQPKLGAQYPGGEAYSDAFDWESVRQELFASVKTGHVEKKVIGKNFRQGKFRLATNFDNECRPDGVHQDQQKYSGIIYLSRNQDLFGGIGLYKCKLSGELAITRQWIEVMSESCGYLPLDDKFKDHIAGYMRDWNNWELIGELPMRFNRAIILMSRCFHASTGLFGSSKKTGRLTQHFEYYG